MSLFLDLPPLLGTGIEIIQASTCFLMGTWPTRFGAATRLSLVWGLPDAPEGFLGAARGDRV
jgi:hypothetical protein